jgi:hypothetical protein
VVPEKPAGEPPRRRVRAGKGVAITKPHSTVMWRKSRHQALRLSACSSRGRLITLKVTAYEIAASAPYKPVKRWPWLAAASSSTPATIAEFRCSLMSAIAGGSPAPGRTQVPGYARIACRLVNLSRDGESRVA